VTRRVCEKITQNEAKPIFANINITFTVEQNTKMYTNYFIIFQKSPEYSIAQSGHPGSSQKEEGLVRKRKRERLMIS
jgi:hypothetical protein